MRILIVIIEKDGENYIGRSPNPLARRQIKRDEYNVERDTDDNAKIERAEKSARRRSRFGTSRHSRHCN